VEVGRGALGSRPRGALERSDFRASRCFVA
jgi:hypothetical protein